MTKYLVCCEECPFNRACPKATIIYGRYEDVECPVLNNSIKGEKKRK